MKGHARWSSLLASQWSRTRNGTPGTSLLYKYLSQRHDPPHDKRTITSSTTTGTVDDPVSTTAGIQDKLLKAPFHRVETNFPPLFPWRHSPHPLPRLDPTSLEFQEKGQLLGGNVYSRHPLVDELATAMFFMNVPWYQILFFRQWQTDMAENMSWAFIQGVAGILSNAYRVPMDKLGKGDGQLMFEYSTTTGEGMEDPLDEDRSSILQNTESMIEPNLQKLYQSAHQFGKYQLQVKLDCRPTLARMENLFVFPFLSRRAIKGIPGLKEKYQQLLKVMAESPRDSIPMYQDLARVMAESGIAESTVICQVLMECDEVFWVKDISTGTILQGYEDEKFRKVYHLVRFEMVVETVPRDHAFIPFQMVPGIWQITDIDDHLDGNLII